MTIDDAKKQSVTDGPTDGPTNRAGHRVVCTRLKRKLISDHENEALRHNSLILFFSVEIDDPVSHFCTNRKNAL